MQWTEPFNGATPITAYTVEVQHADGITFSAVETCDSSVNEDIVALQNCVIPVNVLRTAPYSLEWGASIWAKVSATNVIGTTDMSSAGNGAIMLTSPDAPIDLSNVPEITTGS